MSDVQELSDNGEADIADPPGYELDERIAADTPERMKALGNPLRNLIIDLVLERAMSVTELAERTGKAKGTIAHHVDVLVAAGLLKVVRTRQVRAVVERFYGRTARTFMLADESHGDDLPFWTVVRTADGRSHPHLVVPYTLDANDMRLATASGFANGPQFFEYLRDAFDVLYAEGAERPKMMSIGMHCRLLGRPGRFASLQRFLDHVGRHEKVWICRRADIARRAAALGTRGRGADHAGAHRLV